MKPNSSIVKRYKLSQRKKFVDIDISPDRPIVHLTNFRMEFKPKVKQPVTKPFEIKFVLKNITTALTESKKIDNFQFVFNYGNLIDYSGIHWYEDKIKEFKTIRVEINFLEFYAEDFELSFEYSNIDLRINLNYNNFWVHIEIANNNRILFSSLFGQGKTTFLNEFFSDNQKSYKVFKIYPVNYSVSSNEDIFKYIKCEILYQLLSSDVIFDKEIWNFKTTLPEYLFNNKGKIFYSFLKILPKVGKDILTLNPILNSLIKSLDIVSDNHNEFIESHNNQQVDDAKKAVDYISKFYQEEGSLFEDNLYTQIIRQLVNRIRKENENLKTVLLIDDLDRMDPEHIFRILNVFSAHFDNHIYEEQGLANKFGFDKIIIVCDLDNIRNIYAHKYGPKCDFSGFINKYYSITPFIYDNKHEFLVYLEKFNYSYLDASPFPLLKIIVTDLLLSNEFTLRNMKSFRDIDLSLILQGSKADSYHEFNTQRNNLDNGLFIVIYYLLLLFDINTLKYKLSICMNISHDKRKQNDYRYYGLRLLFNALVKEDIKQIVNEIISLFKYKEQAFKIVFHETKGYRSAFSYHIAHEVKTSDGKEVFLSNSEFYDLLILNIDKYEQMGGLKGLPNKK